MKSIVPQIQLINRQDLIQYQDDDLLWYVYFLCFGDKFYIGCTSKLSYRINAHHLSVNRHLKSDNSTSEYRKIIEHIKNEKLTTYTFRLYAYCYDKESAMIIERELLGKYWGTKNFLNVSSLAAHPFSYGSKYSDIVKNNIARWRYLFKPTDIELIINLVRQDAKNKITHNTVFNFLKTGNTRNVGMIKATHEFYKGKRKKHPK